jgi:integrase
VPEVPPTPQPCVTPDQVEKLIEAARPHEKPLFTALAYSGLRIGELVALRWQDVIFDKGQYGHLHIRLGGSNGTTKGKASRLIPIHPKLREILDALPKVHERVFLRQPTSRYPDGQHPINDRHLLAIVKKLCKKCGFPGWEKFKLHTFRHAFASMCARNHVSYKYALNWMGHKSSDILDMYVTMHDDAADMAMQTISYSRPANSVPTAVAETKSA